MWVLSSPQIEAAFLAADPSDEAHQDGGALEASKYFEGII